MQNKEIIKEGVQKSKNPPLLKTDHRIFKIAILSERTRLELSNGWLYAITHLFQQLHLRTQLGFHT